MGNFVKLVSIIIVWRKVNLGQFRVKYLQQFQIYIRTTSNFELKTNSRIFQETRLPLKIN